MSKKQGWDLEDLIFETTSWNVTECGSKSPLILYDFKLLMSGTELKKDKRNGNEKLT